MVLHDVARGPGLFVELAAALDADVLGHRDLDVIDVVAVPDGLEDRVAEAQDDQVLDGLLAQVVVDAEDLPLVEDAVQLGVERVAAGEIVPEGLLDDDARVAAGVGGIGDQPRLREALR